MAMCLVLLAAVLGNAASATKLQTARSINGTNFDGTGNITTTKWGTSRNIALTGAVTGNANVDGSGNVTIATTQANIAVLTSNLTGVSRTKELSYPSGYNMNNCVVVAILCKWDNTEYYTTPTNQTINSQIIPAESVELNSNKVVFKSEYSYLNSVGVSFKIVLMKVS